MRVISEKVVKIRKPRQCFGCFDQFGIGASMSRQTCEDAGEIYSVYICSHCQDVLDEAHDDFEDGFGEGELAEWEREHRKF